MAESIDPLITLRATRLRASALALRAVERNVVTTIDAIRPFDRDDVWRGAVADRFTDELGDRRHQMVVFAEQLALLADQLDMRADAMLA